MGTLVCGSNATTRLSSLRARLRRGLGVVAVWLLSTSLVGAQTETVTYIHTDLFGSPLAGTGAAGELLWKENYQPYGERFGMGAGASNDVRFHGKPVDQTTGLSEFGARWYDGQLGRFMGADPAGFSEANVHSFNRYAYGNNNPYKYVDPDGNSPIDAAFLLYDLGNLGVALYRGDGVGEAAVGVGLSTAGVIIPLPAVGLALKAERAARLAGAAHRGEQASELVKGTSGAVPAIKAGATGGATGGKSFGDGVRQAAKAENPARVCVYCRREGVATQVDHAIPRATGGNATLDNAQLACLHCNASKGAREFPVNPPPGYRGAWPPSHWKNP